MQTVDIFDFARRRHSLEGDLGPDDLPRLLQLLEGEGSTAEVHFSAKGVDGDKGLPGAELALSGKVVTRCIRCGRPMTVTIEKTVPFLFTRTEAEADRMPVDEDGGWEVTPGSERFDVAAWVEDEMILSLPAFPKHEGCPRFSASSAGTVEAARNPFAALAALRK